MKKLEQQDEVLHALRARHAEQNARLSDAVQDQLLAEDDQVVQHHAADHANDHPDVKLADVADDLAAEVGLRQRRPNAP